MRMRPRITLSNIWASIENRPSKTFLKTDRTEAFLAQIGMADNIYCQCFLSSVCATTPAYMTLMDGSSNELSPQRVLCSTHQSASYSGNSALNLFVYHAEFEAENGFTIDGTPVAKIALYSAATGGTQLALYALSSGLRDERFYKWRTQRLIVDFSAKAS